MPADATPVVEMRSIVKNFGPVRALRGVDLRLDRHEVLGLVGDNGAGKSTLMKVLTGVHQSDAGQIFFEGQQVLKGYARYLLEFWACAVADQGPPAEVFGKR